ncbi:hypothetical protein B0H14DRAFT_2845361 [Mycena olivaceomarginata]|nr:hypothetical protein B0H14DRAFT_2845361 [Mycena olivaceomarginata]
MVKSFIRLALAINFGLAVSGLVLPRVAPGTQFITGPCTADADCASGCCGVKTSTCNARAVAEGPTGGGCLGGALAAAAPPAAAPPTAVTTAAAGAGTQFITGVCSIDGDCASGCCGAKTGVCNARAVAEGPGGGGCGGKSAVAAPPAAAPPAAAPPATATPAAAVQPTQFITGKCSVDGECQSGCCGTKTGVCNARAVAEGPGGGGCGGSAAAAAPAAAAPPAAAPPASTVAPGTQFITGPCTQDGDCASTCCGAKTGVCNARAVAEGPGGGGCGGKATAA